MEMRKCERGHYYDASVNAACPYCSQMNGIDRTQAFTEGEQDIGRTVAFGVPGAQGGAASENPAEEGRTVAMIKLDQGIDPVVGWLVCIEGKERGKDYRIHTDNNYIGRSERMDICIRGDETISRENQAIITYDAMDKIFYISPGEGRSILRVNNQAIFQTVQVKAFDRIMLGRTLLLFLPLCGEDFEWEAK